MPKTALIVDDSKSARFVLKRMLEAHDLRVETSESAEAALEYLDGHRPDVIFMDHLMPGMDGFQAVTAIKKNPDTAMIPIMMYTSQEGEVYVGQARALGAVGVLPKAVEPVEVSKVLASLHLTEDSPPAAAPDARALGDVNLQALLEDLFDQQREILQRELRDTATNLSRRLAEELQREREPEVPVDKLRTERRQWLGLLAIAVLLFAAATFWQQTRLGELEALNATLAANSVAQPATAAALEQRTAALRAALDDTRAALYESLEWGTNQSAAYGWNELPLNDRRAQLFDNLLDRLLAAGFAGAIAVEVHVGDYCLVDDGTGQYTLAPPTLQADACEQLGVDPAESLRLARRQSVTVANFLVTADDRSGGAIRFDILPRGNLEPRAAYPETTVGVVAADWNAIASLNNRVDVRLIADTP